MIIIEFPFVTMSTFKCRQKHQSKVWTGHFTSAYLHIIQWKEDFIFWQKKYAGKCRCNYLQITYFILYR